MNDTNDYPEFEEDQDPYTEEEIRHLYEEAHAMGIHVYARSPAELDGLIAIEKAKRPRHTGPTPPCYGVSYDPTDRRCCICQIRSTCAEADKKPRITIAPLNYRSSEGCSVCGKGDLSVPLLDYEEKLKDYGCTTVGCHNTLSIQCGWMQQKNQSVPEIAFDEPVKKVKKEKKEAIPASKVKVKSADSKPQPIEPDLPSTEPKVVSVESKPKLIIRRVKDEPKEEIKLVEPVVKQKDPPVKKVKTEDKKEKQAGSGGRDSDRFKFSDFDYRYDGEVFSSVTAALTKILNYGPKMAITKCFINLPDHGPLKPGMILKTVFKFKEYKIEVVKR